MLKPEQKTPGEDAASGCARNLLFTFGPELSEVPGVTLRVTQFLETHGVPSAEAMNARLAASEACNNALQYSASRKPATIEVSVQPGSFQIIVADHSEPRELSIPTEPPPADAERGRGLFLIRQVMDTVEYRHETGGNKLILSRAFPVAED